MNVNNAQPFEGQEIFIGLDVHKRSWKVTELYGGNCTKTYSMFPSPADLVKRLHHEYPGAKYNSVYEAGFCGFWIHRELSKLGVNNIVINPADVPTSQKERLYKNDVRDSKKLARELLHRSLKPIYIPDEDNLKLRDLVRRETQVTNNIVRCKNRIKGYLNLRGKKLKTWGANYLKQLKEMSQKSYEHTLFFHLDELLKQRTQKITIRRTEKLLIRQLGKEKLLKLLLTIPGIGFRTGILIIAEIWDIKRFKKRDTLGAYAGFAPRLVGSGEKESTRGSGKRKHKELQSKLIEAAWRAIGVDVELRAKYCQLTSKGNSQRAITVVAKKLLLRVRAVWLYEREYKLNRIQK